MIREGWRSIILGITGYGKSFWFKNYLMEKLLQDKKPIIIFDRKGDYMNGKDIPKKLSKKLNKYQDFDEFYKSVLDGMPNEIHVIKSIKFEDYNNGLSWLEKFIEFEKSVTIVLEEAHDIFNSEEMKAARNPTLRMIKMGRSAGIDILFISQGYYDVPKDIRRQFEGVISFRQNEPADLAELSKKFSEADKLPNLERGEFLELGIIPKSWDLN